MEITRVLSTEMRLLEPICSFSEQDGYSVYRSEQFPNYYGGNGITIHQPGDRSLAEWESIFCGYFDPERFCHTTFTFAAARAFEPIIQQAIEAEYNMVERTAYMFVDHAADAVPIPEEYVVRRVASEDDWEGMHEVNNESYREGDYYDPNYTGPDRLFEKKRFTSEKIGIEWFYISPRDSQEMLATLGIFQHNGICRLQEVETRKQYRRRGLASALVSFAIRRAIDTLGTEGLALCADTDYHAIELYRRLGFVEVGETVMLMKYPIRNPEFIEKG